MSYWTLVSIIQEARDLDRLDESERPVACPNDGTPLLEGKSGVLYCPFDGWSSQ